MTTAHRSSLALMPLKYFALAIETPDGKIERMPLNFEPQTRITVYATTRMTMSVLCAMVAKDNSLRKTAVNAYLRGFANVWKLQVIVHACNLIPYLTGIKNKRISKFPLVWQPRTIVGIVAQTGATVNLGVLPCKSDITDFCAFEYPPHDESIQACVVASSLLDGCLTPDCKGAVWGSYNLCSSCVMRYKCLS
tara:strand:+ start:2864 stop:3442 length:579 start_codon:yes stop_codon:yes gene_type:complete